ncbi:MAG: LemA family protein [Lachnospiraceae bacterium]|nr:LemA family protein [Lachnospiraceae bacterium]MDD5853985.1 LemA family protein [Lachnospiraceae bacterium]
MMFWIIGIVVVAGLIGIFVVKGYNSLVVLKNRVENQAAQIDVQLKRRADLIPNILETTKGYARYEQDTLKSITQLRTQILSAEDITASYQASEKLGKFTSQIFAVGEQYPDLKANANFLQLQKELSETEDKISKARQFYNDTVTKYNDAIMIFPNSLLAGLFGFHRIALLEVQASEKEAIKIEV